jgi:hypothetical protein
MLVTLPRAIAMPKRQHPAGNDDDRQPVSNGRVVPIAMPHELAYAESVNAIAGAGVCQFFWETLPSAAALRHEGNSPVGSRLWA